MSIETVTEAKVELVRELVTRYPDRWVLFEVIGDELDEFGGPKYGRLVAYSADRSELHDLIQQRGDIQHFAIWYTGELIPENYQVML